MTTTRGRRFASFVSWLLSLGSRAYIPGGERTFRRDTARFWLMWPMPEVVDGTQCVVFVDGVRIARDAVVPIVCGMSRALMEAGEG